MKTAIATLLFLAFAAPCYSADDYEMHIRNLAAGKPEKDIRASLHALEAAGPAAFPALLAHFSDRDPAEAHFLQQERIERAPDGSFRLHSPTMGEICFEILQGEIEGAWPKGFRQYYVLTPGNTKAWLDAHQGFTLAHLRGTAIEESLRHAEADLVKNGSDESLKTIVAFLREQRLNIGR